MSKTISFVASDELAEFLEEESERRMTTISSTAQMLLAEKVREMQGGGSGAEADKSGSDDDDGNAEKSVFDRHPDAWYRADGKKNYAVHVPEDADVTDSGKRRYYKTRSGVAEALRRWYE